MTGPKLSAAESAHRQRLIDYSTALVTSSTDRRVSQRHDFGLTIDEAIPIAYAVARGSAGWYGRNYGHLYPKAA